MLNLNDSFLRPPTLLYSLQIRPPVVPGKNAPGLGVVVDFLARTKRVLSLAIMTDDDINNSTNVKTAARLLHSNWRYRNRIVFTLINGSPQNGIRAQSQYSYWRKLSTIERTSSNDFPIVPIRTQSLISWHLRHTASVIASAISSVAPYPCESSWTAISQN
jgi:hypothetical protein